MCIQIPGLVSANKQSVRHMQTQTAITTTQQNTPTDEKRIHRTLTARRTGACLPPPHAH